MEKIGCQLVYFTVIVVHILLSPFTKVEESFYLQATHDFIYKGNISSFDHRDFPGVVPRTALPSFMLATLAKILLIGQPNKFHVLLFVRILLGGTVAHMLWNIHYQVKQKFGTATSIFFMFNVISQPHFLYYASRTLPNIVTMPLVLKTLTYYPLSDNIPSFIQLSALCILVFRSELALLFGSYLIWGIFQREIGLIKLITNGILSTLISVLCTIPFDSYFWNYWLWPEALVFKFNALEGKSAQWGVMPFTWYFEAALPRACLLSVIFIPFGVIADRRTKKILFPALFFVLLYSFNGHKELRFILYIIPLMNIVAAVGMNYIYLWKKGSKLGYLISLGLCGAICINTGATSIYTFVSSLNYPGGHALQYLHTHLSCHHLDTTVYICNLAAETGVSRFGQECDNWSYDKTEHLSVNDILERNYTHLITENTEESVHGFSEKYRLVKTFDQYHKIRISPFPPGINYKEALVLLERRNIMEELAPKDMVYEHNFVREDL